MKISDIVGTKIGVFTVLKKTEFRDSRGRVLYECECGVCGRQDYRTRRDRLKHGESCGCIKKRKGSNSRMWKGHEGIGRSFWNQSVLRNLKSRGERRKQLGVSISIEYAWDVFIKQEKKCALSGIALVISTSIKENTASIDRIDSNIGYHEGNIQWVHKDINAIKMALNQEYFIELCKKVAEHNDKTKNDSNE